MAGTRSKPSAAWTERGRPPRSRNCLAAPKRRPLPAAGRMPTTLMVRFAVGSEVEDFLQIVLDLLLGAALGERELLDEERTRRVQHLAFAEGELLVGPQAVEIPQDLRDLEDRSGLDLLHVFAVPTVPCGGVDRDFLLLQDLVDLRHGLVVDDRAQPHGPDLVDRDHDLHAVFEDAQHVERLALTRHLLVLDAEHLAYALSRINRLVTDLEGRLHPASPLVACAAEPWGGRKPCPVTYHGRITLVNHKRKPGWHDPRIVGS